MELDELIELLKTKIVTVLTGIGRVSSTESDAKAAEAVEYLTKSIINLHQLKKEEKEG